MIGGKMFTYIVEVVTKSRYVLEAESANEALWIFGSVDPSHVHEIIEVQDENGQQIIATENWRD